MGTGFESFWTYVKQDIISKLGITEETFKPISENCEEMDVGFHCSSCVCSYRNSIVDGTIAEINQILELARSQALTMYGVNIDDKIQILERLKMVPMGHILGKTEAMVILELMLQI